MSCDIKSAVESTFSPSEQQHVWAELDSITAEHVMGGSQINLEKTRLAVVQLSKGDLPRLKEMVKAAKKDFRDVIYWAGQ